MASDAAPPPRQHRSREWTPQFSPADETDDHDKRIGLVEGSLKEIKWTLRLIAGACLLILPTILGKVL